MGSRPFVWASFVLAVLLMIGCGWAVIAAGGDATTKVLVALVVPVVITLVPIVVRHRSAPVVAAWVLWAWIVVATIAITPLAWAIAVIPATTLMIAALRRRMDIVETSATG